MFETCPHSPVHVKGVCCGSNGSVCCPNNYNCDKVHLSCQLSQSNFLRSAPLTSDSRQCASSDVACSYDQTCCRTFGSSDGGFACCAFADVCDSLSFGLFASNQCLHFRLNAVKMVDTVVLVARRATFTRAAVNPNPHFNSIIDLFIHFIFRPLRISFSSK